MKSLYIVTLLAAAGFGIVATHAAISKAFLLYSLESQCVSQYIQSGYERSSISTGNGKCTPDHGNARSSGSTDGGQP
jgi:hypothetical protein